MDGSGACVRLTGVRGRSGWAVVTTPKENKGGAGGGRRVLRLWRRVGCRREAKRGVWVEVWRWLLKACICLVG